MILHRALRGGTRRFLAVLILLLPIHAGWAEIGDIVFARDAKDGNEVPVATFPHYVHRMQFKCHVCHDAIFEMKAGANPINMDAIQSGRFCGTCHNGVRAFQATFDTCPRCHRSTS